MREIWAYLRVRKKFWLVPILAVLGIFGALMMAAETSVIAPFIYTLF